ncbi:dihydrodipicolinate synthase family protein [Phytohabitans sp. ZYX-F-186]|uniref:Dihydrodipicolinate synthase family protein n=1 Tax=Phytohabitans maris TaxID=3071409 RepID=A0ABU0ZF76_9ACTN|nr:dihydrodipicolinate synthase family protein [Phytohabitans sp. ZYX-F-186]MDQ7905695.1 dihydrodipicolinate synthase family protein [Phytohabitans sp. ZYX-F-186]
MTSLRYSSDGPDMALLTAVFTPFTETGELALDTVPKQADDLLAWGSAAAYVGGTAGEGASLSTAERMALVERWCEVAAGRLDVIVHVGHSSVTEARRLAEHAESVGARAISAVPPYFHRPETVAALVDACAAIAGAAPTLPFTYYHIPSMTGVNLRASDVLLEAREKIPTFAGLKFAHNDMVDLQRCLHVAGGRHEIFVGVAKLVLAAWQWGARAAIGSVYNFAGPLFRQLLDHAARGELAEAQECQLLAQQVIDAAARHGGELTGFKAMGALFAVDCGGCRPPLVSPGPERAAALRAEVTALGFTGRGC